MDHNPARSYQTQAVMTASPAKLVAMLYGKAIGALREAIEAIRAGDIERRWRANATAQEIVAHLYGTLDLDRGGDVAGNLEQLYRFMLRRLPQIDLRNDAAVAEEILGLLEPLARSWEELAERGPDAAQGGGPAGVAAGAPNGTSPNGSAAAGGRPGDPPRPRPISVSA